MADGGKKIKKTKKNAFMLYCDDQRNRLKRNGFWDGSTPHLVQLCQNDWKALPESEKDLYKVKAKSADVQYSVAVANSSAGAGDRKDSTGVLLTERRRVKDEEARRQERQDKQTESYIPHGRDMLEQSFMFFQFMPAVILDLKPYPCELGIVEFSLMRGIIRTYHKFIHPGELPSGSLGALKEASESYHKVPFTGFQHYDKDYATIYQEILDFISVPKSDGREGYFRQPLFTVNADKPVSVQMFQYVADQAGVANCLREKVFQIEYLHYLMGNQVAEITGNPAFRSPTREQVSMYAGYNNYTTRCFFHAELDDGIHCALANAKSYAYYLADIYCKNLGIEMTEKHTGDFIEMQLNTTEKNSSADAISDVSLEGTGFGDSPTMTYGFPSSTQSEGHRQHGRPHQRPYHDQRQSSNRYNGFSNSPSPAPSTAPRTATSAPAAAGAVGAGRGRGRGAAVPAASTAPPGGAAWASTAQSLPSTTMSSASSATRPPNSAGSATRPPNSSPWSSASASSTVARGVPFQASWDTASPSSASLFAAEDVRELEQRQQADLCNAVQATSMQPNSYDPNGDYASSTAGSDDEWQTVDNRRARNGGGSRGRGATRTGPQQPLRRPKDIRGPRM